MNRITYLILPIVVLVLLAGYLVADWYTAQPLDVLRTYVGRTSCADCHQEQSEKFKGSHHDKAMDLATEETVLGDFDDQTIEHYGVTSRLFRDGDRFMINTEGPDGEMTDFEVKYVFGFTPLQQYMVEIDPATGDGEVGRVQVLRVSWDTEKKKWFYLSPPDVKERLETDDPLHWTGITQNWNTSCAECHSTNLQKGFQVTNNSYHTTFSEIDVSCEACHGPASLHLELAKANSPFWDRNHGYGLAKLKSVSNVPQTQACAPCHSRRSQVKEGYQPGCNFDDYYALQTLNYPIYQFDGQIRDEDYVYGSFLQSKMYHNGIRCSDCHDPHTAKLIHTGNQVCTSCHQHSGGKYDSENHHHHKMGSEGAACVNCHMATTHYMELDGRRDHSFRVPDPGVSVAIGTPNACTACHLEFESKLPASESVGLKQYLDHIFAGENGNDAVKKNLAEIDAAMLAACKKWYPPQPTNPNPKTKYYQQLAKGQSEGSLDDLLEVFDDKRNPVIMRATAITAMLGLNPDDDTIFDAIKSSDVMVQVAGLRLAENRLLEMIAGKPGPEFKNLFSAVTEKLSDSSSRVTQQAAWAISLLPNPYGKTQLTGDDREAYLRAMEDYKDGLEANRDRASAHLIMAGLHEREEEFDKAIGAYRNAMSVQPEITGPRSNLAALLERQARRLMQDRSPEAARRAANLMGEAETFRKVEHQNLGRDVERTKGLPNTASLNYRFGMSCYLQQDFKTALEQLELAVKKSPENETYVLGLATYLFQIKQYEDAAVLTSRLIDMDPKNQQFRSLMSAIENALKNGPKNSNDRKKE